MNGIPLSSNSAPFVNGSNTIENAAVSQKEAGFTLIEVMMSAVVLAIGLLALAAMQGAAIKANYQAKKHTLAVALAENRIESYRNMAYDTLPSGTITESDLVSGDVGHFTRVTTIQNDTPVAGLKTITVSVSWNDAKLRTVTLKTIIGSLST